MAKAKTGSEQETKALAEAYGRYCAAYVLASMGDSKTMADRLGEAGSDPKIVAPYALGVRDAHEDKGIQPMKDLKQELSVRGVSFADAPAEESPPGA